MIKPMAFMVALLIPCFLAIDCYFYFWKEDISLAPWARANAARSHTAKGTGGRASEHTPLVRARTAETVPLDYDPDSDDDIEDVSNVGGGGNVPMRGTAYWESVSLWERVVGSIDGWRNVPLVLAIPVTILLTGIWEVDDPQVFDIHHVKVDVQDVVRDCILYAIGLLSVLITPTSTRIYNGFSWFPVLEVGQLFLAIFITIIPAVAILDAGLEGELSFVVRAVTENNEPHNLRYFWFTGVLSSFLDNAPTFLIFFNVAGGDPEILMNALSTTLLAISTGSVFMGAGTLVGNAPNLLVKSIIEDQRIHMPSFLVYILWSVGLLFPCLIIMSFVFFW